MDSTEKDEDVLFVADDFREAGTDDERGTLVIGPWDEPYTAYQRALYRAMEWLVEAHIDYQPESFVEIHLLGGVLKLRENGDLILNVMPLTRGFGKLFDWMWDKGLP